MSLSKKADPFREHQEEYTAREEPTLVTASRGTYLTITGRSHSGEDEVQPRVRALYRVARAIEKAKRKAGREIAIRNLEALWWESKPSGDGTPRWNWKLMVRVPDFVTHQDLAHVKKQHAREPLLSEVWLEQIDEGRCIQVLHVGPYEREQESVDRMSAFAQAHGLQFQGFHHEIYLTHPAEAPPERMRTILRQPVVPATAAARIS